MNAIVDAEQRDCNPVRVHAVESTRPGVGLRVSPPGATAITLLHVVVSFVCFDKIINLQNHTFKAWDQFERDKGSLVRN